MNKLIVAILIASCAAVNLRPSDNQLYQHACDYIDNDGETIETSLAVQLDAEMRDDDGEDSVAATRIKFAQMQAKMEADVAAADAKRAE